MPRHESHDKKREFSGEEDATRILNLLNLGGRDDEWSQSEEANGAKERVQFLLFCLLELLQAADCQNWPITLETMPGELLAHFISVNDLLRSYVMTPMILPNLEAPRGWELRNACVAKCPDEEADAVSAILRLLLNGKLDRIRMCECGRWHFLRFAHQRFCSEECRVKFWEATPERKEQKRLKARSYYEYHKIRNKE